MQGAEERRLRRISNTPQGGATEGNAADDALMVNQDFLKSLTVGLGYLRFTLRVNLSIVIGPALFNMKKL